MRYFDIEEFECSCCKEAPMDASFLQRLDKARELAGVPFVITSGYRCLKHNEEVGGVPSSSHVKGKAADIKAEGSRERFKIVDALLEAGFDRVGIASSFIHVDNDDEKSPEVMWVYK